MSNSSFYSKIMAFKTVLLFNCSLILLISTMFLIVYPASTHGLHATVTHKSHSKYATILIIVPGHAIYQTPSLANGSCCNNESCWVLEDYQKGESHIYIQHIMAGIKLAAAVPNSILIFAGGQTRANAGPISESESYLRVAMELGWNGMKDVADRAFIEEYSRDSFENLLFSICKFNEIQGYYPNKIFLIGFRFKRKRFVDLHRAAISFPIESFHYIAVPSGEHSRLRDTAFDEYTEDIFGCAETISAKRHKRNPFGRSHNYLATCTNYRGVLSICSEG
jgi:hypothetical protein